MFLEIKSSSTSACSDSRNPVICSSMVKKFNRAKASNLQGHYSPTASKQDCKLKLVLTRSIVHAKSVFMCLIIHISIYLSIH